MLQSTGSQRAGLNFEKPTTMLTLPSKLKQGGGLKESWVPRTASDSTRLLVKEAAEAEANLRCTCKVRFPNLNSSIAFSCHSG